MFILKLTNNSEPQTLNQKMTNHLLTKVPTIPTAWYSSHTVIMSTASHNTLQPTQFFHRFACLLSQRI